MVCESISYFILHFLFDLLAKLGVCWLSFAGRPGVKQHMSAEVSPLIDACVGDNMTEMLRRVTLALATYIFISDCNGSFYLGECSEL